MKKQKLIIIAAIVITILVGVIAYLLFSNSNVPPKNQGYGESDFSIVVPKKQIVTAIDSTQFNAHRRYSVKGKLFLPDPYINIDYRWKFSLQFKVELSDLQLSYDKPTNTLTVNVLTLDGSDILNYEETEVKVNSGNLWNEKGTQANQYLGKYLQEFSKIEKMAEYSGKDVAVYLNEDWKRDIVNGMLPPNRSTNKNDVIKNSKESIQETLTKILSEKNDMTDVKFEINIKALKIFDEIISL